MPGRRSTTTGARNSAESLGPRERQPRSGYEGVWFARASSTVMVRTAPHRETPRYWDEPVFRSLSTALRPGSPRWTQNRSRSFIVPPRSPLTRGSSCDIPFRGFGRLSGATPPFSGAARNRRAFAAVISMRPCVFGAGAKPTAGPTSARLHDRTRAPARQRARRFRARDLGPGMTG